MPGAAVMPAGSFSVLQSNATEMHEMKEDSGSKETCRLKKKPVPSRRCYSENSIKDISRFVRVYVDSIYCKRHRFRRA